MERIERAQRGAPAGRHLATGQLVRLADQLVPGPLDQLRTGSMSKLYHRAYADSPVEQPFDPEALCPQVYFTYAHGPCSEFAALALVAVDWLAGEEDDDYQRSVYDQGGFHPLFADIAKLCDDEECDTILYALWTHSVIRHGELKKSDLFGPRTKNVQNVILEVEREQTRSLIEVWTRSVKAPHRLAQHVSRSSNPKKRKQAMMDALPSRAFGRTTVLICGEINMIQTRRDSDEIVDDFGFMEALITTKTRLILNAGHDCMIRPEMRTKRAVLSNGKRWLLSVWNRGNKKAGAPEARNPWLEFYDGNNVTERVAELSHDLGPDVRIGTVVLTRR